MTLSRRSFVARTAAAAIAAEIPPAERNAAAQPVAAPLHAGKLPDELLTTPVLHGYGSLAARLTKSSGLDWSFTTISCETSSKALLTQAKYLSDLVQLPGVKPIKARFGRGHVPCHQTEDGDSIACYAHGADVVIAIASSKSALETLIYSGIDNTVAPESFRARVSVPMWLDRWDKYGLLCYFDPNAKPTGASDQDGTYDDGDSLKFAKDHAPIGFVPWSNPLVDDHAEGLTNEASWAWMQEHARKMGIPVHINTQIAPPLLWLSNRYREQTMLKSPQFLGGYYGVAHDSAVVGAISWLSLEAEDTLLGIFQSIVRRFAPDPNIVGWLEPHGETGETPQKFFLDSGPYTDKRFRDFLRTRYSSVEAVSQAWYGDRAHYKEWDEIKAPEIAEFAGFDKNAIDLRTRWQVRYLTAPDGHIYSRDEARNLPSPPPTAPIPDAWFEPGFDDSDWDTLVAPGNDHMLYMPWGPMIFRRTLDISQDWLAASPKVTLTIWDLVCHSDDVTTVHVNGKPSQGKSHLSRDQHWSEFDVSGLLVAGSNQITLVMPRGIISYRAYLTSVDPKQYPNLGRHLNAKWVDFVEWNIVSRGQQIRRGAEMIRKYDPHRSISFMAANDYFEPILDICRDYCGRFHDTGSMAGYWTEWNTLIMSGAGLPVTAEAGNGAPNQREFQLFWGRWLTEGLNGVHYFQNWGEIAWNPAVLKTFETYFAMYTKVGKYHSPFTKVGILFSIDNDYLTGFPWTPERSESHGGENSLYNAAGALINFCPRAGITAGDFLNSKAGRFQVVIDTNTTFMSEALVAGIERFVHNGGIFITYGETGRHTPVEPDSWPICRLTGFTVAQVFGWGDGKTLSPEADQTILRSSDLAPETRALGLGLKADHSDSRALARWNDGSVAIGLRQLGRGHIVQIGPQIRDQAFVKVISALFGHFGIRDRVPAAVTPHRGLHFRHFVGNTGLHDIWIIFNESDESVTTSLTFLPGFHPKNLTDVVTREKPEIHRSPDGDTIADISLVRWESRMYISPRDNTCESPKEWLTLQAGWWQGAKQPPAKRLPTPAEMQRFTLDISRSWAYKDIRNLSDADAAGLVGTNVNDSHWERRDLELWLTPGDLEPKRHLLRRKFTVPAHWTSGKITLCADMPGLQFEYNTRIYLDGAAWNEGRQTVDGPYFDEMGGALKPGTTHLIALEIRGKSALTGSRGPMWLTYLPEPQSRENLSGAWKAHADALKTLGEVQIPGKVRGASFSKSFVAKNEYADKNVVFYFEAPNDRYSIIVNGSRINSSELIRARAFSFNITPLLTFGPENPNVIEIVGSGVNDRTIGAVEMRYYDKGVYP